MLKLYVMASADVLNLASRNTLFVSFPDFEALVDKEAHANEYAFTVVKSNVLCVRASSFVQEGTVVCESALRESLDVACGAQVVLNLTDSPNDLESLDVVVTSCDGQAPDVDHAFIKADILERFAFTSFNANQVLYFRVGKQEFEAHVTPRAKTANQPPSLHVKVAPSQCGVLKDSTNIVVVTSKSKGNPDKALKEQQACMKSIDMLEKVLSSERKRLQLIERFLNIKRLGAEEAEALVFR